MGKQTEYFDSIGYQPTYWIGDRVFGHWNNVPFVGSVGNDTVIDNTGPRISIHLDLPIKHEDRVHNIIVVTHKDISKLKQF
jgi:hypothetical protein